MPDPGSAWLNLAGPDWLSSSPGRTELPTWPEGTLRVLAAPPGSAQACSLSALQSRSFTSGGSVLNKSSSTTRPLRLSSGHSPSSTGRHSSRLPRSSICVRLVSSPTLEGSDCSTLLPRCRARNFRHWKSSGGSASICRREQRARVRCMAGQCLWAFHNKPGQQLATHI